MSSSTRPASRATASDTSPSRYVARIDRATGRELDLPILPGELLVQAHRDRHPLDITAQLLASRLAELTGGEWMAREGMRRLRRLGEGVAHALGGMLHDAEVERRALTLLGIGAGPCFRFREVSALTPDEIRDRLAALREGARAALAGLGAGPRFHLLLTGATGFLGKEVLVQALEDPQVAEIVCLLRWNGATGQRAARGAALGLRAVADRGERLLRQLGIRGASARRVRFVQGDIELARLGLGACESSRLRATVTHVVHCAASVTFDDSYESLFRANVVGSRNALAFSLDLQRTPGSPFVAHVAVETSYIHGRLRGEAAREDRLAFPPHFYNNFYELTKAMAAIETERTMLEEGLRVAQLLPSIVVGDARTGNNRGDTKVVNAPVNAFGRVKRALDAVAALSLPERLHASVVGALGARFPADPSAELNLVTVDRVAAGILASLTEPRAVGSRIHLATDRRVRSAEMIAVIREELELDVRLADPTLTRLVTLPLAKAALVALGEPRLGQAFERLGALFGGYVEWGQTVHAVGDDVKVLELPARRPDALGAFRMMCRHARFVQEFGSVRDPDEIARRERLWERAIDEMEFGTGRAAATLSGRQFRRLLECRIELARFRERRPS